MRRFPICKDLRTHLQQAQKTIMATAILQNMAAEWCEVDMAGADDDAGTDEEADDEEDAAPAMGSQSQERAQGSLVREAMVQARFLSINSEAISVMTTPQHYFYFNFKKNFLRYKQLMHFQNHFLWL